MGGFRDLVALVLGWKSSRTARWSCRAVAGRVHVCGADNASGRPAGQIHTKGAVAGQIHG